MAAKKNFTDSAAGVFVQKMITPAATQEQAAPKPQPKVAAPQQQPSSKRGRKPNPNRENEERVTFIMDRGIIEKLRGIAYHKDKTLKVVTAEALSFYLADYEKKNGEIKVR